LLSLLLEEGKDVLLRHPTASAGPRDLRHLDTVLGRDPSDDRRYEGTAVAVTVCLLE
jgi:hypothetical protein